MILTLVESNNEIAICSNQFGALSLFSLHSGSCAIIPNWPLWVFTQKNTKSIHSRSSGLSKHLIGHNAGLPLQKAMLIINSPYTSAGGHARWDWDSPLDLLSWVFVILSIVCKQMITQMLAARFRVLWIFIFRCDADMTSLHQSIVLCYLFQFALHWKTQVKRKGSRIGTTMLRQKQYQICLNTIAPTPPPGAFWSFID